MACTTVIALVLCAVAPSSPPHSSAPRDSAVVTTFSPLLVRALPFDPRSSQAIVRLSTPPSALPVDDLRAAFAARPGVVVQAGDLHVRGGRAGETSYELFGLPLADPWRGAPLEVPADALAGATLLDGGLEAQHAGALAGVLGLELADPPERPRARLEWTTDGATTTRYDRVRAAAGGPLGVAGLGACAAVEARLDDTALPALRSEGRHPLLGVGRFGWRADNHLLAHVQVAPAAAPGAEDGATPAHGFRFEALAGRIVTQPYDRMFTLDGWVKELADSSGLSNGPVFSPTPKPGYTRYRAADHVVDDDMRQVATIAAWEHALTRASSLRAAAGFVRVDRLAAVGGRTDPASVTADNRAEFGLADWPTSDPFDVYAGDEPLWRRDRADRWMARGEWERGNPRGVVRAGLEARYDHVGLREVDGAGGGRALDSVRTYDAFAPGGAAWVQSRIGFEGLVANLGARLGWFSPGPQARHQSLSAVSDVRDHWTLAPRVGVAFPVGMRDALAFSYTRIDQDPARDFLYDDRNHVVNRQPVGNPGLEPATVINYEVSWKHVLGERAWLGASYYYRDLFGLVGTVWEEQPGFVPRPTYANSGNGHAAGIELSGGRRWAGGWSAHASYTYGNAVGPSSLEEGARFGVRLGERPPSVADAPLDWDVRHALGLEVARAEGRVTLAWTTVVHSGLPWTPSAMRAFDADLSQLNARRLPWSEETNALVGYAPPVFGGRGRLRLEARNLFDHRGPSAATIDGYPNAAINTLYDDYGAYRTATGQGGGAYADDLDGDGVPDWTAVHDPRLDQAPRTLRLSVAWSFE